MNQFVSFNIIENNTNLRSNGCPIFYKVPPNDSKLKNEYGLVAYEFDQSSYSCPKMRTLLQIVITVSKKVENDSSIFIEKANQISRDFLAIHLENIKYEILNVNNYNDEVKKYLEKHSQDLHTEVKHLAQFDFIRELNANEYLELGKSISVTKNNFTLNDIDSYYEEAENIMKFNKWESLQPIDIQNNDDGLDEVDHTDNLIDELFDSIDIKK